MVDTTELATAVEMAVRATPGVDTVYRSGSLVANLAEASAAALGLRDTAAPLISVVDGDAGVRVEASLGVDSAASAPRTLDAARQAISTLLTARGLRVAAIRLTVVYVHSREAT